MPMSSGGREPRFLRSIQHLRAVAASMVVLHHSVEPYPGAMLAGLDWGQAGVATFFVISGYIIWSSSRRERPAQFALRRLIRIVPVYWLALLLVLALNRASWGGGLFVPSTVLKSFLFIPYFGYGPGTFVFPILVPSWTLYIEVMFYAVFWLGMVLGRPLAVSGAVLCGLVALGALDLNHAPALMLYSKWICLLFVAGMLIARHAGALPVGLPLVWMLAGAMLVAGWAILPVPRLALGCGAVALVVGVTACERTRSWPAVRWLAQLGDASYAIYLFHLPALGLLDLALARAFPNPLPWPVYAPLCLACAWGTGLVVHRWVERPMIALLQARLLPLHRGRDLAPLAA